MKNSRIYITVTVLFVLYIATVFFFCLYNFSDTNLDLAEYFLGIRMDRLFHFLMFFPYPFVCWLFFNYNKHIKIYKEYTFAAIILSGIVLAAFAEASQELFTSYRDSDPYDLGANLSGIMVGCLIAYILRKPLKKICNFLLNTNG
ncbi:MAG: hypothetical protein RR555_00985 [Bacteroidales bacterium]